MVFKCSSICVSYWAATLNCFSLFISITLNLNLNSSILVQFFILFYFFSDYFKYTNKLSYECRFYMHIVNLSVCFSPILLNRFSRNLASFPLVYSVHIQHEGCKGLQADQQYPGRRGLTKGQYQGNGAKLKLWQDQLTTGQLAADKSWLLGAANWLTNVTIYWLTYQMTNW